MTDATRSLPRDTARRRLTAPPRYDLAATVSPLVTGAYDPTTRLAGSEFWWAARSPDGPVTVRVARSGATLDVTAWGAGTAWALAHAEQLLGLHDEPGDFPEVARRHPVVARLAASLPGPRFARTGLVYEALVRTVLQQKVTTVEAFRGFAALVRSHGDAAPGPGDLRIVPAPERLAALPYWALHPLGIEQRRADTLHRVAFHARRMEEAAAMPPDAAASRLTALPGVGPWTAAEVAAVAFGDPDAVSVGDYHLPHQITYALAGERRGDDTRMLALLEPFRGHRGRVARLVVSGAARPGRRAPRAQLRSFAQY